MMIIQLVFSDVSGGTFFWTKHVRRFAGKKKRDICIFCVGNFDGLKI